MSMIKNLKDILSFKLKVRHDSYTDQYSRIFMVKILLISTTLLGLNWYSDRIRCIISSTVPLSNDYVADACWIQGFYLYDDVNAEEDTVAYAGIPTNLDHDGRNNNGAFCIANPHRKTKEDINCIPLRKTIYLQYQYMTFFMASLAMIYYIPYLCFRIVNSDMISLKMSVKSSDTEKILKSFFNSTSSQGMLRKNKLRIVANIIIKLMYVGSNVIGFFLTDRILHGKYITFAMMWAKWSHLPNHIMYDYMGLSNTKKPGNMLLPTFGICELHEGARNLRSTITDKHKFICEYSQHILYHYVLLVLWFTFVFGMFISTLGFIAHCLKFMMGSYTFLGKNQMNPSILTFREFEYLEYIRKKDKIFHDSMVQTLQEQRNPKDYNNNNNTTKVTKDFFGRQMNGHIPKMV